MRLQTIKYALAITSMALATAAFSVPMTTPASAAYVTRRVHGFHGRFGHGCRTVRSVIHLRFGRNRVIVRRRCS